MLKKGDLVKVTETTITTAFEIAELIPIGTICKVLNVDSDGYAEIVPLDCKDDWVYIYAPEGLEKGQLEWIPESDEVVAQITWKLSDITNVMEQMGMNITQESVAKILNLLGYKTGKCVLDEYSDMIYDAILNAILDAKMKSEVGY